MAAASSSRALAKSRSVTPGGAGIVVLAALMLTHVSLSPTRTRLYWLAGSIAHTGKAPVTRGDERRLYSSEGDGAADRGQCRPSSAGGMHRDHDGELLVLVRWHLARGRPAFRGHRR